MWKMATTSSELINFFFNDTATTEIYTLSLHDALPILPPGVRADDPERAGQDGGLGAVREKAPDLIGAGLLVALGVAFAVGGTGDRKSTRLNSSHANISYAVFCLKKKKISSLILTASLR